MKKRYIVIFLIITTLLGGGALYLNKKIGQKKIHNKEYNVNNEPEYQNKYLDLPKGKDALSNDNYKEILFVGQKLIKDRDNYNISITGTTQAKTIIGNQKQIISGRKIKNGDLLFKQSNSYGLKKLSRQYFINDKDGYYITRDANEIKKDKDNNLITTFNDNDDESVINFTKNDFLTHYGNLYYDFSPYVINDYSVLDANLVNKTNESIEIKYNLDARYAAYNYKREIATLSGVNSDFKEMHITVTFDKDYKILKVKYYENYDLDMLGTINTTGNLTDTFTYDKKEIKEYNYFKKYFNKKKSNLEPKESSLDYINKIGEKPLYFKSCIKINNDTLNFKGYLNSKIDKLNNLDLTLEIDNKYKIQISNNKLYFKYKNLYYKFDLNFELANLIEKFKTRNNYDTSLKQAKLSYLDKNKALVNLNLDCGNINFTFDKKTKEFIKLDMDLISNNQNIKGFLEKSNDQITSMSNKNSAKDITKFISSLQKINNKDQIIKLKHSNNNEIPKLNLTKLLNIFETYLNNIKINLSFNKEINIDIYKYDDYFYIKGNVSDETVHLKIDASKLKNHFVNKINKINTDNIKEINISLEPIFIETNKDNNLLKIILLSTNKQVISVNNNELVIETKIIENGFKPNDFRTKLTWRAKVERLTNKIKDILKK